MLISNTDSLANTWVSMNLSNWTSWSWWIFFGTQYVHTHIKLYIYIYLHWVDVGQFRFNVFIAAAILMGGTGFKPGLSCTSWQLVSSGNLTACHGESPIYRWLPWFAYYSIFPWQFSIGKVWDYQKVSPYVTHTHTCVCIYIYTYMYTYIINHHNNNTTNNKYIYIDINIIFRSFISQDSPGKLPH